MASDESGSFESSSVEEKAPTQLELRIKELSLLIAKNKELDVFLKNGDMTTENVTAKVQKVAGYMREKLVDDSGRTPEAWSQLKLYFTNSRRAKSVKPIGLPERIVDDCIELFTFLGKIAARLSLSKIESIELPASDWLELMTLIEAIYKLVMN